jgi:hypothetical protein
VRKVSVSGGVIVAIVQLMGSEANVFASPTDDAEPLVQEGIAFREQSRDSQALEKFQRAYRIAQTPRIVAQIGAAEQALGRWTEAEVHLSQALGTADDPWIVKNRSTIESALVVIGAHLGSLEILGSPAGAEIRVEGGIAGTLPLVRPLRLPAGRTTIEVRAPGYFVATRTVPIDAGKLTRETVDLRKDETIGISHPTSPSRVDTPESESTNVHASPPSATSSAWRRPTEVVASGLALAGLALGIVEHVRWQNKVDSFESMDACGANLSEQGGPMCQETYSDGHTARTVAIVGYTSAIALGATAAILYLTDSGPEGLSLGVACAPAMRSPGIDCAVRF